MFFSDNLIVNANILQAVHAKSHAVLPPIISEFSLDPVSLITLFFDEPEKELLNKSGDLTLLSGFGLFVNPSSLWNEYRILLPGQGLEYYNPGKHIRSTIENQQVNLFLTALGNGYKNRGIIIDLYPLTGQRSLWWPKHLGWEWWLLRPLMLFALILIAGLSEDYWGIGAIVALLFGQLIAISISISDGISSLSVKSKDEDIRNKDRKDPQLQYNVFFLHNNVTMIIRCPGDLFRRATSHFASRRDDPVFWKIITTITFLLGILLVGFTTLNFKIAYLTAHAVQAILIALASGRPVDKNVIINRTQWEQTSDPNPKYINRRRVAYVWACQVMGVDDTEWLKDWDLARGPTLDYVNEQLKKVASGKEMYVAPIRRDHIENKAEKEV